MCQTIATCDRCESPLERGDLRCAVCGDAAPHTAEVRRTTEVEVLRCDGCGASLRYDPEVRAPRCTFCDSTVHVEKLSDPQEAPDHAYRFTVDAATAQRALKAWLGQRGFFCPSDLRERARVHEIAPLYWAGWIFDAEARVSYTADTDADSGLSEWAPTSGQLDLLFDDVVAPATRGLTTSETYQLIPSYVGPTQPEVESDFDPSHVEQFDVQRSTARRIVADTLRRRAADVIIQQHLPGRKHRNVHVACVVRRLVTRRALFPAYVLAYRYQNELYRVVISGQDARCIIGDAPKSWAKIVLTALGVLAAVAVVGLILFKILG